jgi:hypothetical protein
MVGTRFEEDEEGNIRFPLLADDLVKEAQAYVDPHITFQRWNMSNVQREDIMDASGGILEVSAQDSELSFSHAEELMGNLMEYGLGKNDPASTSDKE